jgi:hypothetical protein
MGPDLDAMDLFNEPEELLSPRSMCFEPFFHMVILPEGISGPCCTFYDPEKAQTVWNTSLKDVWMGHYMQEVRGRLLQGKPMDYCKECMLTRISANRDIQAEFGDHMAEKSINKRLDFVGLVDKARHSLSKHGVMGSIKRGREWYDIRIRAQKRVKEKADV